MLKLRVISDFNADTLARFLSCDPRQPACAVSTAPFGLGIGTLLQATDATDEFAVVWTTPERTIPAFRRAVNFERFSEDNLLSEVHEFTGHIKSAASKFRAVFLVCWTVPPYQRGYGMMDLASCGIRNLLIKMNLKLADELRSAAGIYVLDGQKWIEAVGRNAYSPKLWYLAKIPFQPDVFKEAARDIKAAVSGVIGDSKKLIVVDLDNTLWGGTVGDVGWESLRLGGHDYVGEAFLDFQKALKALSNRGILLAIVSKNEETIALEALSKHPEMILRPSDFVGWRINWSDKAANIAELAMELKLGLQSMVFIDDNAVERARVREALPDVYVPEWPSDATLFASQLLHMECFDSPYVTGEDSTRADLYAAERQRDQFRKTIASHDEWLRSLNTEVVVEAVSEANRVRVAQLLNKTNQMNLSTRRMTETELSDWLAGGCRKLWAFRVKDRFGDSGLVGLLTLEISPDRVDIRDFVLSCRVMGRKIEKVMVAIAVDYCHTVNAEKLVATYIPTPRNKPCLDFWKNSGFRSSEDEIAFTWGLDSHYPRPDGVKVTFLAEDFAEKELMSAACGAPPNGAAERLVP